MSGPDQGDEDKSFLARWSQRKQEAKQPEPSRSRTSRRPKQTRRAAAGCRSRGRAGVRSLQPAEAGGTDRDDRYHRVPRKGVPEHLRNAALRKSWALDPAIRNYVNPALEYAYDWNTPGGVPGSGELGAGMDVARMVSQIMGDGRIGGRISIAPPTPKRIAARSRKFPNPRLRQSPRLTCQSRPSGSEQDR